MRPNEHSAWSGGAPASPRACLPARLPPLPIAVCNISSFCATSTLRKLHGFMIWCLTVRWPFATASSGPAAATTWWVCRHSTKKTDDQHNMPLHEGVHGGLKTSHLHAAEDAQSHLRNLKCTISSAQSQVSAAAGAALQLALAGLRGTEYTYPSQMATRGCPLFDLENLLFKQLSEREHRAIQARHGLP